MKRISKTLAPLFCLTLVAAGCALPRQRAAIPVGTLKGRGKVFLVPLGDFPRFKLHELKAHYREKYGLSVSLLPPVALEPSAFNEERQQFVAELLVGLMRRGCPEQAQDPAAILIGLTGEDIYINEYNWQFTFSWRQEGRFAVVSDARMHLGAATLPAGRVESRLRKMVTKNIGIMHYGLRPSDDPRSVLYNSVGGLRELDRMGEDF